MRVVDLFSGAGGFTLGATMAGAEVVGAANHWPLAVEYHERNHPGAVHVCQDLHQADFSRFPDCDTLLASPSCVGHTSARGKEAKHHDKERSTAWAVVSFAEAKRPEVLLVENVPAFVERWVLYPAWATALELLGYTLTVNRVRGTHVGLPQVRERVIVVGVKGQKGLSLHIPKEKRTPFSAVAEWERGLWRRVEGRAKPLVEDTLRQYQHGRKTYGERFIIPYYGAQRLEGVAISADAPLWSIPTHDRYGLVRGDRMRMLSISEARKVMGVPADYALPPQKREAMRMLGNMICPPVAELAVRQVMERS